ncbi:unannotated protein [freshwater metagenome]|uniref:Unannotated protein n=1 Tax=freshwater metagenome TaxID=449393 RepID=A0A6J7CWL0_9ZZZZ|nr:MBL fold metallo-hydrolase [Actinomycetota bacterium]
MARLYGVTMALQHQEIDVLQLGRPGVICCHRIGDVIVDPGPEASCAQVVDALAGEEPRAILLTHIHLDHAAATGALLERWPGTEVWVHELGVAHLVDPSRLIASATRIYGDQMDRLWGRIVPVPQERLRVLRGGETLDGFRVAYTPGHAKHHVSYLHEETGIAFVGDVAGVRLEDVLLPPTPPPDIDLELWQSSLDAIEGWGPSALALTHFGTFADVDAHLARLREGIEVFGRLSRERDPGRFEEGASAWLKVSTDPDAVDRVLAEFPLAGQYVGLERYWAVRAGA